MAPGLGLALRAVQLELMTVWVGQDGVVPRMGPSSGPSAGSPGPWASWARRLTSSRLLQVTARCAGPASRCLFCLGASDEHQRKGLLLISEPDARAPSWPTWLRTWSDAQRW